jgi:protein regulator of cytokinesis 1
MTEEAHRLMKTIKQMEASLDDNKPNSNYETEDSNLKITYPLMRCLQGLKEKYNVVNKLHRERFEQVRSECTRSNAHWNYTDNPQNSPKPWNPTRRTSSPPSFKSSCLPRHRMQPYPHPSTSPPRT